MERQEILNKAKWIEFPSASLNYKQYDGIEPVKVPMEESDLYRTWSLNQHHFPPMSHFRNTMPVIANVLDFCFKEDDFLFKPQKFGEYDLTMPYPKFPCFYDAECLSDGTRKFSGITYDELTRYEKSDGTEYHRLYRFFHDSSIVVNRNIKPKRSLFISADSHMIPVVPMLTTYFKTIVYIDNRKQAKVFDKVKDIAFTDVLFCLWQNSIEFYTVQNLK